MNPAWVEDVSAIRPIELQKNSELKYLYSLWIIHQDKFSLLKKIPHPPPTPNSVLVPVFTQSGELVDLGINYACPCKTFLHFSSCARSQKAKKDTEAAVRDVQIPEVDPEVISWHVGLIVRVDGDGVDVISVSVGKHSSRGHLHHQIHGLQYRNLEKTRGAPLHLSRLLTSGILILWQQKRQLKIILLRLNYYLINSPKCQKHISNSATFPAFWWHFLRFFTCSLFTFFSLKFKFIKQTHLRIELVMQNTLCDKSRLVSTLLPVARLWYSSAQLEIKDFAIPHALTHTHVYLVPVTHFSTCKRSCIHWPRFIGQLWKERWKEGGRGRGGRKEGGKPVRRWLWRCLWCGLPHPSGCIPPAVCLVHSPSTTWWFCLENRHKMKSQDSLDSHQSNSSQPLRFFLWWDAAPRWYFLRFCCLSALKKDWEKHRPIQQSLGVKALFDDKFKSNSSLKISFALFICHR